MAESKVSALSTSSMSSASSSSASSSSSDSPALYPFSSPPFSNSFASRFASNITRHSKSAEMGPRSFVPNAYASHILPTPFRSDFPPYFLAASEPCATMLHVALPNGDVEKKKFAELYSGYSLFYPAETINKEVAEKEQLSPSDPRTLYYAARYAGHQFGSFAGQLGDGRAISIGELINPKGERYELQMKGAGQTPYSRGFDGRAVLRSSIREFLISEGLHHLGVPSTRALSLVASDEKVFREEAENCAVVCRVSPTFIRFGSFQIHFHGGEHELIPPLIDYLVDNHFKYLKSKVDEKLSKEAPTNTGNGSVSKDEENEQEFKMLPVSPYHSKLYELFFMEVVRRSACTVAKWQCFGFTHGVMNTDNCSVLGLSLDHGPFEVMNTYDEDHTPNHSDETGRYKFSNQPQIMLFNLNKLAIALTPVLTVEQIRNTLVQYELIFAKYYYHFMKQKLGILYVDEPAAASSSSTSQPLLCDVNAFENDSVELPTPSKEEMAFVDECFTLMQESKADFHIFFRTLFSTLTLNILSKPTSSASPSSIPVASNSHTPAASSISSSLTPASANGAISSDVSSSSSSSADVALLTAASASVSTPELTAKWLLWIAKWRERVIAGGDGRLLSDEVRWQSTKRVNPKYVLRTWVLETVIRNAKKKNLDSLQRVLKMIEKPYDEQEEYEEFSKLPPCWASEVCLSCSS